MRKSALKTAAILLSLYASFVQALGVGGIDATSALNEPLNARIELTDTDGLRSDELIVRLASVADFEATGIEYASFLSDFEFTVEETDGKQPLAIKITSPKTVREPYVNFLINISWPNGRLVKEYTILLDPVFGDSNLVSYNQNIAQQVKSATAPESELLRGDGSASRNYANRLNGDGDTPTSVTVLRNDTMWEIAARVAPSGASVHQTMHAIKAVNPDAFINNNINRVKAGYVLSVPTADEITAISRAAAVQATQRDLQLWTGDKTAPRNAVARTSQQPKGELTLAAANDASASDAASLETISALKSENQELDDRLAALEKQLSDMNRLLQLKNAQLALMQEQGAEAIETAKAQASVETAQAAVDASQQVVADESEAVATAETAAQVAATASETAEAALEAVVEIPALRGNMPQPIEAPQPLWANPIVQLGILTLLLVALGAAFFLNRKKEQAVGVDIEDADIDLADEDEFDPIADEVDFAEEPVSNAQLKALEEEYDDVAYEEIVEQVESRLASQPHRADLQLFLLQQSAHNDDKETYVEHFKSFEAIGKAEDINKAKNLLVAIKGSLFWLEEDQTVVQAPVFGDLEPEPETGIDEGDEFFKDIVQETELTDEIAALLEASEGAESLDQADVAGFDETLSMTAVPDDEGLDFSVDDAAMPETADVAAEQETESDEDELDFDLGGFELPEETPAAKPLSVDEGDELDFEATLETDSASVVSAADSDEDDVGDLDIDGLDFGLDDLAADTDSSEGDASAEDLLEDLGDLDFGVDDSLAGLTEDVEEDSLGLGDSLDIDMDGLGEETIEASVDVEEEVAISDDSDLGDLDDLFDDFDLSAASNSDSDAQVISDAEGPDGDADDLSSLLDGMDVDVAPEVVAEEAEDESAGIEGDIIDLSEFLDDSDSMAFDAGDIDDSEEGIVEESTGSDDFDDLDDLSNLLDGLDADLDMAEEMQTKLGMAEAFIEMGDAASAKDALNEVIESGDAHHRESARSLLAKLGA